MDATANKLKAAIEHRYGGTAHLAFLDAVSITRQAQPACEGVVFVFDLVGHPEAERAYGWTSPVGKTRVLSLHRWPIFLADEGCQGDWLWDFGASGAGVKITSRTG